MDSPVIAILDQNETYLSKMDNSSSGAIHFFNETLHTYLQGSAYTFECSVVKDHDDLQHLQNGHKLSFREDDTDYQLSIIDIREDEKILKLIATGISLEMTKEHAGDYSATEAMSFAQYLNVFDPEATITLNINEISSKLLTLSWEGETTSRLSRLFSLANKFDAEIEFKTILKDDYSLDKLILNVYQKHDNSHQGIGQKREDIKLEYGVNVNTVSRHIDSSQVFTAIRATNHEGLDLVGWEYREYDENNRLLFESPKNSRNIYAPQARGRFPSNSQSNDRYTAYEWTYDTDNQEVLGGQALARLKELCEPTASYQIEGYFDLKLGDLVHVVDDGYTPTLLLSVRVSEQEISWTNPSINRTTFTNVKVLESEVDTSLLAKVQALIEANKTYTYSISSTNGIVFKNNTGTTQLMATVKDGIREITEQFSIRWLKDGVTIFNGTHLTVAATDVEAKAIYEFEAINSDGAVIGGTEVTLIDVNDGLEGRSIANLTEEYYLSTSKTSLVGGSWDTTRPAWTSGKYVWTRIKTDYSNPTGTTYTDPIIDSSWEAIDDIEIGGRNLLTDTKEMNNQKYKTTDRYKGLVVVRTTNGISGYLDTYNKYISEMPTEEDYTLSFYAKSDLENSEIKCYFYNPNTTKKSTNSQGYLSNNVDGNSNFKLTTEWKRYWVNWEQSKTTEIKKLIVGRNMTAGATVEIAGIMFNEGNKSLPHLSAPEDVEQAYTAVAEAKATLAETQAKAHADGIVSAEEQSRINDAQAKLNEAKTYADGLVENIELTPGPAGENAITGYLTNESLIIPATATGSVVSLTDAHGYFRVMDGNDQATSVITFSIESQTGVTVTLNSTGYYEVTGMSNDFGLAVLQAVYKGATITKQLIIVKSKQGPQGADGAPTGVYVSSELPPVSIRYVGMLWHNTGASGYLINTTYRWTGSSFVIHIFSVNNFSAEFISAISANLGTVTAGIIQGSNMDLNLNTGRFFSEGTYEEGGVSYDPDGQNTVYVFPTYVEIQDGVIKSSNPEQGSGGVYTDIAAGTIYMKRNPGSIIESDILLTGGEIAISKSGSKGTFRPDGLLLNKSGVGEGQIEVEQLLAVEPKPLNFNSGFTTAESNPPTYRVTKLLDGSYQCELSGQIKLTSGNMVNTTRYYPGWLPSNARPLRNEFFQVAADRMGGRLGVLAGDGRLQLSPAETTEYMGINCRFICNGPLS